MQSFIAGPDNPSGVLFFYRFLPTAGAGFSFVFRAYASTLARLENASIIVQLP